MKNLWTFKNWQETARKKNISLGEAVLQKEREETEDTPESIQEELEMRLQVMQKSLHRGLSRNDISPGGMLKDEGQRLQQYFSRETALTGSGAIKAAIYAIAIGRENAGMGRIVALPTGGAAGIVPGVLLALAEAEGLGPEELHRGLLIAAGTGMVVGEKLEMSGAAGGCQAECGVAAGMAAAGGMALLGRENEQAFEAFALSCKNLLGLTCDPVGGLVEVPCVKRNGFAAVQALLAMDLVRGGLKSVIPPDEIVDAMAETAGLLPGSLKETARAGLARTKTGLQLMENRED